MCQPGQPCDGRGKYLPQLHVCEEAILEQVATGAGNTVIAQRLGLMPRSIQHKMHMIYVRLDLAKYRQGVVDKRVTATLMYRRTRAQARRKA